MFPNQQYPSYAVLERYRDPVIVPGGDHSDYSVVWVLCGVGGTSILCHFTHTEQCYGNLL
jgi:hypothetical protein